MEIIKQNFGICEGCGKPDQPLILDPFYQEVYGEYYFMYLCDDCFTKRCEDTDLQRFSNSAI